MYFATPTGQINRGTMYCPTLKLKAIWTNSEQTNFLGFCPRICSAYLKQQYCEINSRMYTYASPAYKVYLVFNLEIAPEPFKTILIESNKFLNVMLCPENGPVLVQGTVLQCTPLVSPALHWCRAVVVWATVSVLQAELGMQPELVMPVVLVIMPCWLSREAARPAGPGGADGTAGGGIVGRGKYGIARYHFRVIMAPQAPWLVGSLGSLSPPWPTSTST